MIRIAFGKICVCVMKLMRLAKVGEGDHARQQSDATPPEVCGLCAAEMTVNTLMGHDGANKYQVGSKQDVEAHEKGIGERNEQCSDREENGEADNSATEIVDFVTMMHVGSLVRALRSGAARVAVKEVSRTPLEAPSKRVQFEPGALYLALCHSTKSKAQRPIVR